MASPSERLAELRAALRELEACVAQFRAKQAAARGYDPRQMSGVHAVGSFDDTRAAKGDASLTITAAALVDAQGRRAMALRLLRPPLDAVVGWWRRSREKLG